MNYSTLYKDTTFHGLPDSILISPEVLFNGLALSRLDVKPLLRHEHSVPCIELRSMFISHSQTVFFPEEIPRGEVNVPDSFFVYAPLEFRTVEGVKPQGKRAAEAASAAEADPEDEDRPRSRSRSPENSSNYSFCRITNSDFVLQLGYYELFRAVQQMFLPSVVSLQDYEFQDFQDVDSIVRILNGAMYSGRRTFADKIKKHLMKSREFSNGMNDPKNRKYVSFVLREILAANGYYNAGPTLQEGRLSTMKLGGDPYLLDGAKPGRVDVNFNNTVYNVLVSVKIVTGRNMYFAYFYISRDKILKILNSQRLTDAGADAGADAGSLPITREHSISFWIGSAMEYLNTPSFISVITNIISSSDHGPTFKDDLIPFLRERRAADFHCSIDSGCKSPVALDIEEKGYGPTIKYIQLDVPDENYLPDDFVVGTNSDGVHFVMTKPFGLGQRRWNGIVIRSNLSEDGHGRRPFHFQVPRYDDALVNEVIGVGEGDVGVASSLSPQPPTSPQLVLTDPLFNTSTSESVPRPDDGEVGRAEPSPLPLHPPADRSGIIATSLGYVGRLFKYLTNSLTSPKMGRSNPVNIITAGFDTVLTREVLGGRGRGGGRGTRKLLKRTTKLKKSYYLRNKVTRRGRSRGRSRKN